MTADFDVLVVGGGHAGIEASLAASRMGLRAAMITAKRSRIGEMSCNPAIGGIAKGTIVREIDSMDGSMAVAADRTCLQFRMLNRRKGPAVWGPRMQSDASAYAAEQGRALILGGVTVVQDVATGLLGRGRNIKGVKCRRSGDIYAGAVVLAAGTFLRGRLFRGEEKWRGGRIGDIASDLLEEDLVSRGFHVERFKTGTPARVLRKSVDTSQLEVEPSEETGFTFSYDGIQASEDREVFFTTNSTERTIDAVKEYLHRSPLLSGRIEGTGPRYCPSFEDKVVKFPNRRVHRIYVEPMGKGTRCFYLNGLSTSLPREAQDKMVRSLPGFSEAVMESYGYAVEYSYFSHEEFDGTLKLRKVDNVFIAGQICGTSGYEEAAGLGLLAGMNASLHCRRIEPKRLSRMGSYIGVMVDDIAGKGLDEPYRMFSSRAENRLHLRQDNADRRLFEDACRTGILSERKRELLQGRMREADRIRGIVGRVSVEGVPLQVLCRREGTSAEALASSVPELGGADLSVLASVILDEKYRGYIQRNMRRHETQRRSSGVSLGSISSYMDIEEICWEAREVLERERPENLAQARRLPGVRPTDINGILIYLEKSRSTWNIEGGE